MWNALLTFSFALSASTPLVQELDLCTERALERPRDYDAARCVYKIAQRKGGYERVRDTLDNLIESHPEAIYLPLVRAGIDHDANPEAALTAYRACAARYAADYNANGELIARYNAAQLLFWGFHDSAQARREMELIEDVLHVAWDPIAQMRGRIMLAAYDIDAGVHLGTALEQLLSFDQQDIISMPGSMQRELLNARSTAVVYQLQFEQAERDLQALEAIGSVNHDAATQSRAAYQYAFVLVHRLSTDPQQHEDVRTETRARLERAVELALQARHQSSLARSLEDLSVLLGGDTSTLDLALEYANDCLSATQDNRMLHALCQHAKSQVLRDRDPQEAYELAVASLDALKGAGKLETQIRILRSVMRRSWSVRGPEASMNIARSALEAIESYRQAQRGDVARQQVFATWTQDYYWLSGRLLELSLNDPSYLAPAFEMLERSRARVLLELMTEPTSDHEKLDQAQQQEANVLALASAPAQDDPRAPRASSRFASLAKIQSQLQADQAMVLYQTAAERSFDGESLGGAWALVVTRDRALPVQLPTHLGNLRTAVEIFRQLVERDDPGLDVVRERLRALIFTPLTEHIPAGTKELIVVPDGPLHALPMSAIAPEYIYSVAPSATIWSEIRSRKTPAQPASGISVVDPDRHAAHPASPQTERGAARGARRASPDLEQPLPESTREAAAISKFLGPSLRTLQGAAATPHSLTTSWRGQDNLLHIAAHSDVKIDRPEQSSLLLATQGKPDDGRLTARQISQLPVQNAVVVLAGCATGWGSLLAGEGVLSLARAFQRAGARTVVASLWPIRDDITAEFFEHFYESLGQGNSVGQALAVTRKRMRARGYPVSSFHGFVALGDASASFQPRPPQAAPTAGAKGLQWRFGLSLLGLLGVVFSLRRIRSAC